MKYVIAAIKAILLIVVVLFCVFNTQTVSLTLIPSKLEYTMPMFLPILSGIIAGAILAGVFLYADRWKLSGELKKTKKLLANSEAEVQRLHNLPLNDKEEA